MVGVWPSAAVHTAVGGSMGSIVVGTTVEPVPGRVGLSVLRFLWWWWW